MWGLKCYMYYFPVCVILMLQNNLLYLRCNSIFIAKRTLFIGQLLQPWCVYMCVHVVYASSISVCVSCACVYGHSESCILLVIYDPVPWQCRTRAVRFDCVFFSLIFNLRPSILEISILEYENLWGDVNLIEMVKDTSLYCHGNSDVTRVAVQVVMHFHYLLSFFLVSFCVFEICSWVMVLSTKSE